MITAIIPVLNESPTIRSIIEFAKQAPGVSEVIVVDDGSIDGTPEIAREAGARVILSTLLGKGASMEDGMRAATNEILVFLDGDLAGLNPQLIPLLTAPLLADDADFAKGQFSRSAGRVTTLTAKPLIATFFPELAHIAQPLGGIIAVKRALLQTLTFESDYGVDVGLLLDAAALGARITQVDIGHIQHDSQPLEILGDMAKQVVRVILNRAAVYGRLDVDQVREVEEVERHAQSELSVVLSRVGQAPKLALFDMDGTLLKGRFVVALAQRTRQMTALRKLLDHDELDASERTQRIAKLFVGVRREVFEQVAKSVPLSPGAVETVIALRRSGYRVGIISDSYRVATEIVRRRVFADFSLAHLIRFRQGVATGDITLSPAMKHDDGCADHRYCKLNVMLHLNEQLLTDCSEIIAVGDSDPDICMLRNAGLSVAFQPKSAAVAKAARVTIHHSLSELLRHVELHELSPAPLHDINELPI
ncbi:MAG: HAD-IB family phosphatase [Planctomycetaceae bacterium]|nr:HAD-IB family phosphatase [Planctomycetaceae bacterium]